MKVFHVCQKSTANGFGRYEKLVTSTIPTYYRIYSRKQPESTLYLDFRKKTVKVSIDACYNFRSKWTFLNINNFRWKWTFQLSLKVKKLDDPPPPICYNFLYPTSYNKVWQNNITEQFHDLKWINIMVSFVYFYILLQANNQLVWITISNVWKLADHIQLKYWQ